MNDDFQSEFVFGLQGRRYQEFVDFVAKPIIEKIIDKDQYDIIPFNYHLTDKDFQNTKVSIFPNFYTSFLADIVKISDKVSVRTKVCICLDERLCSEVCPTTGRKFSAIKLANVELVFFIYFNITEFYSFLYNENFFPNVASNIIEETENSEDSLMSSKSTSKLLGYIHNHNEYISFIRTSLGGDGFPISHSIYPEIADYDVGTPIIANCKLRSDGKVSEVISYDVCKREDLPFIFKIFEGVLNKLSGNTFAFVVTEHANLYVPRTIAKNFVEDIDYQVSCLAVESLDNRGEPGWEVIEIIDIYD